MQCYYVTIGHSPTVTVNGELDCDIIFPFADTISSPLLLLALPIHVLALTDHDQAVAMVKPHADQKASSMDAVPGIAPQSCQHVAISIASCCFLLSDDTYLSSRIQRRPSRPRLRLDSMGQNLSWKKCHLACRLGGRQTTGASCFGTTCQGDAKGTTG